MQHLHDYGISDTDIRVPYLSKGYTDETLPSDITSFYSFPSSAGWNWDHLQHKVDPDPDSSNSHARLPSFLQAWLWFGLIRTVVQKDGQPLLTRAELLNHPQVPPRDEDGLAGFKPSGSVRSQHSKSTDPSYVSTLRLRKSLDEWATWETAAENQAGIRLRMIRLEKVLSLARGVVRRYCAGLSDEPEADPTRVVGDEIALSLMVLGETLAAVKSKIMERTNSDTRGWHGDDDSGWGPPRLVLERMKRDEWCPRTVHLLRGQFRSNATLLLVAYYSSREARGKNSEHVAKGCDTGECKVKPEKDGEYTQIHHELHRVPCKKAPVDMSGPDPKRIRTVLESGQTPLLRFDSDENNLVNLSVISCEPGPGNPVEYATISHVWSDGWGNETENTLCKCQLQLIRLQLRKLRSFDLPFWVDTLVIPVGDKDLREKAISQIFKVFRFSKRTLVLDLGLIAMPVPEIREPVQTAMRLLASNWMRRLWTLQEAFLSKTIRIAFKEHGPAFDHMRDYDKLLGQMLDQQSSLSHAIAGMVQQQLRFSIMDHEREKRNASEQQGEAKETISGQRILHPRYAAILIVNAWRAARWRTTQNEIHEALALSTLLGLDCTNTRIASEGFGEDPTATTSEEKAKMKARVQDELMEVFWKTIEKRWEKSIPPGIIFLPGQKIQRRGFGWAPRTWMSAHEVDFPDPLSNFSITATLDSPWELGRNNPSEGLKVRYPGFLLHLLDRKTILDAVLDRVNPTQRTFSFPADGNLHECYTVEGVLEDGKLPSKDLMDMCLDPLAIVLSRPRPRQAPKEIGLLVQIHNRTVVEDDGVSKAALHCEILCRVRIWREAVPQTDYQQILFPEWDSDDLEICIGEALDTDQIWYVDSFCKDRHPDLGNALTSTRTTLRAGLSKRADPQPQTKFGPTPDPGIGPSRATQSGEESSTAAGGKPNQGATSDNSTEGARKSNNPGAGSSQRAEPGHEGEITRKADPSHPIEGNRQDIRVEVRQEAGPNAGVEPNNTVTTPNTEAAPTTEDETTREAEPGAGPSQNVETTQRSEPNTGIGPNPKIEPSGEPGDDPGAKSVAEVELNVHTEIARGSEITREEDADGGSKLGPGRSPRQMAGAIQGAGGCVEECATDARRTGLLVKRSVQLPRRGSSGRKVKGLWAQVKSLVSRGGRGRA